MHSETQPGETPNIRAVVRHIGELPAPPSVAARVMNTVMEESADFGEVARLIESDPALTLKVLRMANAAALTHRGKIATVEQAIATLGFDALRSCVLSVIIRESLYRDPHGGDPLLTHIWRHTLACAVAADLLAEHALPGRRSMAFAAGMIHDCGQLVLLTSLPETYEPLVRSAVAGGPALLGAESRDLGVEHTQVGKLLLSTWNMPEILVDAAWLHHHGVEALAELGEGGRLAAVVALADIMAHEVMLDAAPSSPELRDSLAEFLGLDEERLKDAASRLGQGYAERAEAFDLDDDDAALFYFRALQRANAKLTDGNLALTRREERLEAANRFLAAVADAGADLARASDPDEVLDCALRAVQTGLAPRRALCYRVDAAVGVLSARHRAQDETRSLRLPLDRDLRPEAPAVGEEPSDGVLDLLSGYLARIPADDPRDRPRAGLMASPPWLTLPLMAEDGFIGELCLDLGRTAPPPTELGLALSQLAGLAAAAVHRLDLDARLEERADRLASALRKIRRMNHKLLQTERLAAVGQLAAGAAHEINNPLAIIYARAQLLEFQETDPKKKNSFKQMMGQIERITSILTNLMDFARPAPPRMEAISLNGVAQRALELVSGELARKNIAVQSRLAPDLPPIHGDGNQLEQVVLNLLINAEHAVDEAHPEGGGSLSVSTEVAGGRVTLTIADNGVGIEAENLNKIFDPFFTTKEEGKGTGLGLSTSFGIVQAHGGDIRFRSRPGEGTEVGVVLPLGDAAPVPPPQEDRDARDAILVVDDEKHIRDILRESLEANGYRVETARDGEQGLGLLQSGGYRLALLDIRMPHRDGLSLLAEARRLVPGMPVIVLTGMAGPDEVEKAHTLGAYKCVRKPFSIDALLADVGDALGRGEEP